MLRRGKAYQDYPCRMNEIYTIYSDRGDEYRLQFTTERSGIIANVLLDQLAHDGIEVVEIGLARVKGSGVTGHKVLGQIEKLIADFMQQRQNVILSFFCDFINLVPSSKNRMSVQEYRSRLFSMMFKRYVRLYGFHDFCDNEIRIEGVAETFFFHVIYKKEHEKYADLIAEGHQKDFSKPEESGL